MKNPNEPLGTAATRVSPQTPEAYGISAHTQRSEVTATKDQEGQLGIYQRNALLVS